MADSFEPGERLNWENNNLIRVVVFQSRIDDDNAEVTFGMHRWTAPLSELTRISPPVLSLPVHPLPPPEPETPPSLGQQRDALKQALDKHRTAQQATTRSREIADRALCVVERMQARLRDHSERESEGVTELVGALRDGEVSASPLHSMRWVQNEQIRRDCAIAERAYDRVVQEFAVCREHERACLDTVYQHAALITGLLLSSEIERLGQLEREAAELRAKLQACSIYWPPSIEGQPKPLPLSTVVQQIISSEASRINDPSGYEIREQLRTQRQQQFIDLFEELVNGNADAELT